MTDTPPQLGQIPQQSGFRIPTLTSNMEGSNGPQQVENAKASIYDSKVSNDLLMKAHIVVTEL